MQVWPGTPYPLGATYDGSGTNFALFSEIAESVELCLFDAAGAETRYKLPEMDGFVWHAFLPNVEAGQLYGYRVYGPNDPSQGSRCNPSKLLLDPYAKSIYGKFNWNQSMFGYQFDNHDESNNDDSAAFVPKSVVISPFFDWGTDRPPRRQYADSVLYEAHVKGLTMRHPGIPEEMRGTYSAIAHPVIVDYLTSLGITAIELMPVHHFTNDSVLQDRGLSNYWGYNTIGFLAPDTKYSSTDHPGGEVQEFKAMVRTLHAAGIEVILDVVYNHTAEGNHLGPTISMRGIDNASYYRLVDGDNAHYMDYTGTGNTLNVRQPHTLQLIMDSLRYWVTEMHVDGFRFDLAAALAREFYDVDRLSSFFELVQQDPIVSQVKLIAEPWDVGPGGYQVGNFPPQWTEWNGKYRDTVRDFWRGESATLGEFAARITGSADLYAHSGRRPVASINFVTVHDGFTLRDLVSYNDKHNDANGEGNNDGESHNRSWNCGVEGPSDDSEILALRSLQQRNFLATVLLSQGVPMICHGDELGRTQQGNNNGYCQDNELTWIDWENADEALIAFTQKVAELRRAHPVLRRRRFFDGRPIGRRGDELPDIGWFRPDGSLMTEQDWGSGFGKAVAVYLNGDGIADHDARGQRVKDDTFFICFSAHHEAIDFVLPPHEYGQQWCVVLDTADPAAGPGETLAAAGTVPVGPRATVVLRRLAVDPDAPAPMSAITTAETLTEAAAVHPGEADPDAAEPSRGRRTRSTTSRRAAQTRRKALANEE